MQEGNDTVARALKRFRKVKLCPIYAQPLPALTSRKLSGIVSHAESTCSKIPEQAYQGYPAVVFVYVLSADCVFINL